ncbi:MAG: ATP synthase F1 subunit delta [Cellulosilyticaceae bacterium]
MAQLVTKRYATALFDIANEQGAMKSFEDQVKTMKEVLENEKDFFTLLSHPSILQAEKIQVVENIFDGRVAEELVGLLVLIIKKGRQDLILDIFETFLTMAKADRGVILAAVTSAVPLKDEQLAQIKANIEKNTGKTIELEAAVDSSLIGGMIIKVGDKVVDGSVRGKLSGLKTQLNNLRLA